jgi:hypothetical protein
MLPLLQPGLWEVRVRKTGFNPFTRTAITLQTNTQVTVDAVLQVSTSVEQVNVVSTAPLLQTTSSTLVQVVDSKSISDLPLNGRNVLQLVSLNAGVANRGVPATVQGSNIGFGAYQNITSMNGARGNSTNYLLDNADHNEAQTNLARPFPNVDALEEFSVQTSSFDAQYGRGVGGVVNVVTKSGTNQLHGSLFEFLRNYKLNAANFFSGRDSLKRNQFGGALGGPIVKDRLFFFGSYQGTRVRSATPGALRTAPSAAMKSGDFSEWLGPGNRGAVRDPLSGGLFPGNIIPPSRFDPVAVKMLESIPTSNDPRYQVRFGTPTDRTDEDQFIGKFDYAITTGNRISGRYFFMDYANTPNMLPDNLLYATDGQIGNQHSVSINDTHTFSPQWVNNFSVAFTNSKPKRLSSTERLVTLEALGSNVLAPEGINLLNVTISGWSGIGLGNTAENFTNSAHVANVTSFVNGRHNLRFGGDFRRYHTGFNTYFLTAGSVTFNGQQLSVPGQQTTGNSYAELLLGVASNFRQLSVSRLSMVNLPFSLFFQDDMRVTPTLTFNFGVRYDPKPGLRELNNQHSTFIAGQQSTAFPNAPQGLLFTGDPGVEDGVIPNDMNNVAPRFGFAWQVRPTTVVRGAYGIFFDEFMGLLYNRSVSGQPWASDATLVGPLSLSNPYGDEPVVDPANYRADSSLAFRDFSTYAVPTRDLKAGSVQNWNLVLEQQLPSDWLIRASYVGSKGTHLLTTVEVNPGIYSPGATAANLNSRRIYPRIGALQLGQSIANSSYNALQMTIRKRLSSGFSMLLNYTYSKAIDMGSYASIEGNQAGPDPFNLRNNRGVADFDVPHRLVASGTWELPRLEQQNRIFRGILGGWQSNFILDLQSGAPLTIRSGVDNDLNGVAGDFADYNGGEWRLDGGRSKMEQINAWFNTDVFARNALGTIGTARRGQLRGPGFWNVDYSVFKNFSLTEGTRLQFRGEFFNVLNHANLGEPNPTVNSANFGVITSASSPRIVQLAIKVVF